LQQNPFSFKNLIQQVVEMELMTIYNLSNYENLESENLKGKLNTIEVELANFNPKKQQN
jgi:hypothetical protein